MIKLIHFITDTNIGGAGRLLCNQIKNMEGSEFEITVALPRHSALVSELAELNCRLIELYYGADASFDKKSVAEDYKIIRSLHPDIVHSHASLSSRIAATACRVPTRIFTRHCSFPLSSIAKNPLVRALSGAANSLFSTSILAVSESARQDLISTGCNANRITTVINGVDPVRIISEDEKNCLMQRLGIEKDNFLIGIFARLEPYKGHKTLLEAAAICKKYYPNFRFLVVGDGSERAALEDYAARLGVADTVRFLGFCADVAPLFNIIDLNVNCSFGTETSSLALSEGMSLGIPAVASDYPGNMHMVKNAVNGLIFPQNNPRALAMEIIRMYRDRELYETCRIGAYKRYKEEFNARAMTEKMLDFYRKEYQKAH